MSSASASVAETAAAASSSSNNHPKTRRNSRRRPPPRPNSVLDRRALEQALDAAGLGTIQSMHMDGFYQALHRQHYPNLTDFVDAYYRQEQDSSASASSSGKPNETTAATKQQHLQPLKNSISVRKNKNRTQFPKAFLDFLKDPVNGFVTMTSTVAQAQTSADGTTTKLAIQLHDGQYVESVIMRYVTTDGSRASLCVSSQCGCAMGCTFCATGTMGLSGNLTTGEILEQVVHADRILADEWRQRQDAAAKQKRDQVENTTPNTNTTPDKTTTKSRRQKKKSRNTNNDEDNLKLELVRNLVFMGMGEPLDNYTNVVAACKALIDRKRWSFAHGKVTVSTVGLPAQMRRFTAELPCLGLALSLHAPNQALRQTIVPTAQHYPIADLIDALDGHMMAQVVVQNDMPTVATNNTVSTSQKKRRDKYTQEQRIQASARRKAMIEYVMLEGETSSLKCAHELGKLCERRHLVVNLIPYNPTNVADELRCPSEEHMAEFRRIVSSYGAFCTIRRTMGADIDSACGQLITLQKQKQQQEQEQRATAVAAVRDIEDVGKQAPPPQPTIDPTNTTRGSSTKRVVVRSTESRESATATTRMNDQEEDDDDETKIKATAATEHKDDLLEQLVRPLAFATAAAACCFIVSGYLFLKQQRRR